MQRHERDVGPQLDQPAHQLVVDVDPVDLVAQAAGGFLDPLTGLQRDLALQRASALEDRDPHQPLLRRRPAVRSGTTGASAERGCSGRASPVAEDPVPVLRRRVVPVSDA